jgi:DNA adenine methylase
MSERPLPRPFLKWAGGKAQLIPHLLAHAPAHFQTYHEAFLGNGALFFHLQRTGRLRRAVLSDQNAELIDTYRAVRDQVEEVIRLLAQFPYDRAFYDQLRAQDPWAMSLAERAARMIYLNKTCYNGLYRVNRQGQFNVPFGRYKAPKYLDEANLRAVARALENVALHCAPFEAVLERATAGDWVYFDPPYVPRSRTANFTAYYPGGFSLRDHERLRDVCIALVQRGVAVTLSNADVPAVHLLYDRPEFARHVVRARRSISAKRQGRGEVNELIITAFPAGAA